MSFVKRDYFIEKYKPYVTINVVHYILMYVQLKMKILRLILAIATSWGQIDFVPNFERACFGCLARCIYLSAVNNLRLRWLRVTSLFVQQSVTSSIRTIALPEDLRTFCISLVVNSHQKSQQYLELFIK